MAVYFPKSLQRIDAYAFANCYSLISTELSPTVEVDNDACFLNCFTLELRQTQVEYNRLTLEQKCQRSRESISWLKVRNDDLPIHKICSNTNTILDQLQPPIHNNIDFTQHQTDELDMTALHLLCLNPKATPEMFKLLSNTFPQAATMQARMVTNVDWAQTNLNVTDEMVTPIKLWLKTKGIPYNINDFDEQDRLLLVTAFKQGLEWHDLNIIKNIQFPDSDFFGVRNETSKLYPFMQAATIDGRTKLETVYHLALYDPKSISESSFETETRRRKKAGNV